MRTRKVGVVLQRRILDYFEYVWSWGEGETEIVQELPSSLRLQLAMVLNKRLFQKLPLFKVPPRLRLHHHLHPHHLTTITPTTLRTCRRWRWCTSSTR